MPITTNDRRLREAAPDMLEALIAVQQIIESTYGHDEEGNRLDEEGDASAADTVEMLCNIDGLVDDAIAKATEGEQEDGNHPENRSAGVL